MEPNTNSTPAYEYTVSTNIRSLRIYGLCLVPVSSASLSLALARPRALAEVASFEPSGERSKKCCAGARAGAGANARACARARARARVSEEPSAPVSVLAASHTHPEGPG